MLQNAYFLAKIGADTAENEQHFAEILPIGRRRVQPLVDACGRWSSGCGTKDTFSCWPRARNPDAGRVDSPEAKRRNLH